MSRKRKSVAAEDPDDKPVYLVVEHKGNKEPSHSVVIAGGTRTPPVMVPLRHAIRGMSFAAVDSRWIVGVGGDSSRPSTVYDLATSTESAGPILLKNKVNPILIPHLGLLYVLSSRPKIHNIERPDFLPWFEFIIFTNGKGGLANFDACPPCELPPPPIFPYCINPLEYADPPDVRVAAYAVVDSHILLSVSVSFHHQQQQEDKGTCAFDMERQVWDMVDTKSLPFLDQAIPIGDHLFAAHSKDDGGAAAVYYMAVFRAKDTPTGKTELSMVKSKLDLPKGGIVPGQQLCALGMMRGRCFSSFDVPSVDDHVPDTILEKTRVIQRTYSLVKGGDDLNKVVKRERRIFKLPDPSHFLLARPAPIVAAFTL